MARPRNAIEAVTGRLFDKRSGSGGGGRPMSYGGGASSRQSTAQRLARAPQRSPSAVFKLIKRGGCTSRSGLKGQLEYVFDKAVHVLDSEGRYEGRDQLHNKDYNQITREWEQDWWGTARAGYTTHLLLSYPIGTSAREVAKISKAVCEEMFQSGDARYEYVAGIHTDRDHPHAHVILNRRGSDNRLFTMKHGSDYSYQAFRDAMVAHGERHGVSMQSSTRFERGLLTRAPTTREVYAAKEEGREPISAPFVGKSLDFAKTQVKDSAILYNTLAVLAGQEDLQNLSSALERMSRLLNTISTDQISVSETEIIQEELSMQDAISNTEAEAFDDKIEAINAKLQDILDAIKNADERVRPTYEKELVEIQAKFADAFPDSPTAQLLNNDASFISPYSTEYVTDRQGVSEDGFAQVLAPSLENTGISPTEVAARMSVGAEREYLEQRWMLNDLESLATARGLSMEDRTEFDQARHELSEVYGNIRQEMFDYGFTPDRLDEFETDADHVSNRMDTNLASGHQGDDDVTELPQRVQDALAKFAKGQVFTREPARTEMLADLKDHLGEEETARIARGESNGLSKVLDDPAAETYISYEITRDASKNGVEVSDERLSNLRSETFSAAADNKKIAGEEGPKLKMS